MIYKFRSAVTGDLIMLGPQGDHMLRLLDREPAPKGIIEPTAMADAMTRLQAAIAADEQAPANAANVDPADPAAPQPVGLRQRLWPMVEMLRRCQAAQEPVVWGV